MFQLVLSSNWLKAKNQNWDEWNWQLKTNYNEVSVFHKFDSNRDLIWSHNAKCTQTASWMNSKVLDHKMFVSYNLNFRFELKFLKGNHRWFFELYFISNKNETIFRIKIVIIIQNLNKQYGQIYGIEIRIEKNAACRKFVLVNILTLW